MPAKSNYILLLPKWYPNRLDFLDGNYIENHAVAIAGYQQLVVLFVRSDDQIKNANSKLFHTKEHGMDVFRVYFKKSTTGIPFLDKVINLQRYIRCQFKGFSEIQSSFGLPALVHIHVLTRTSGLAFYLKRKFQIPFLISEHWSGYFPENGDYAGWIKKWMTKQIVKQSSGVSTVSTYLKDAMIAHGLVSQYEIIPNVVDTSTFSYKEKQHRTTKKIIHVSGMSKIPKNTHSLIKVCEELAKERDDFELHMVGDGPEMSDRKDEAKEAGLLDKKVFFYGDIPMEQVADQLQHADFLVLCSIYENQPCVLIESISTGTPVIAPTIGGIPEHFSGNGLLIPKKDNLALKNAISTMLDDATLFNTHELRAYAVEHFSHEVVGKQFSTFYHKILSSS